MLVFRALQSLEHVARVGKEFVAVGSNDVCVIRTRANKFVEQNELEAFQ